ncbi:DUF1552 domain-containing protein [Lignipirellula cremea]|uniref:DUF1552 domain-containing protein n=1 Tax=Lignipirellula cremea TaxID=2528010 RepID=A0A518E584_9BACT|nr:DUF1552 domain-containing protein [Lignipirellula cremea]QDU99252.1 hypothetical protein Pla8534_71650 [Lignipirellula cremea]
MSNFNSSRWLLNRRHALRGMGVAIALPMLNCMKWDSLKAAETPPPAAVKRSVFIYVPNGVNTLTWQIQQAGADYQLTSPLASLEKHRSQITPISGLYHPSGIGQAHECDKIWLTGAKVSQEGGAFRNTISADQLMAETVGAATRFSSLELSVTGGTLAWSRDGVPLPAERRPISIFQRLFGEEAGGVEAARRRLDRRASVLDLVLENARSLRSQIGVEDRSRLDEYLHSVRDVELRTERAESWLDIPKPAIDKATEAQVSRNIAPAEAGDYYRTMYDLMVLALRTDMTRVVTCMSGSESNGLAIPEIGVPQTRHELSHHNGDPEQLRRLTMCDTFLAEQFAYFLERMQAYGEGGDTLLDSTQVLWGSGMAYGHSHGNANLPTILAGGRALGLRHGQHLDYNLPKIGQYDMTDSRKHYGICSRPVDSNARLNNLLVTMLQRMGVETENFGDSLGSISEIVA